ncbi:MAG: amino acid--tRNA ligase-related protein [Polyangiaceae bacterium]
MSTLWGRITATWEKDGTHWIELISREKREQFRLTPMLTSSLRQGDIVKASLTSDRSVVDVTLISRPADGEWDALHDGLRWRSFGARPSRMRLLQQRYVMTRAIRQYFHGQGFIEIQPPLLVKGTCPDPCMRPFVVDDHYLSTSTEYQLKRLLVGGFEKIFSLTQNFRKEDKGVNHNPEFTMLEWARAFEPLEAVEADAAELVRSAVEATSPGQEVLHFRGHVVRVRGVPWDHLTVREAFRQHLGIDVSEDFSLLSLKREIERIRLPIPKAFLSDRHALVSLLLDIVSPKLGCDVPLFLRDWPSFMTSSAKDSRASGVVERSELFIGGLEISDGFPALQDPKAQRRHFNSAQEQRAEQGLDTVTLDETYLKSIAQGLPPAAGMALGFDRLTMVILDEADITRVLPFAWDEL